MFPIRDHNPSRKAPYVVFALIALNVAVYLYGLAALQSPFALSLFYERYAMIPAYLNQGGGYTGLVTHMFLHGGFMHLAGNMLFLWIFGDNMEEEMGHLGFLAFYLASGLGAALGQYFAAPFSPVPMVGASGAIAGVMGGYLLLFPRARVDVFIFFIVFFRILVIPAWIILGLWFGLQLVYGVGSDLSGGGVAYWAHIGGFVIGLVLTIPLWLVRGGPAYWSRVDGHPPHPKTQYTLRQSSVPTVRRRR
ncbi:rhomboid family intramembrane serine protease [Roseisalinus antarcticus]|uniref:Rhomboid protease GluP n=1 Tax=Roseisalinus antarcticus TaxID=254357 RepID=A0A1Y5RYA5_9RHOB|nr:rhomboid family intramembrane serine protease [Roseisalinus antarcticus]SLN28440.1 Rhomboid protease GluP [Roseisalinus antarcticus]